MARRARTAGVGALPAVLLLLSSLALCHAYPSLFATRIASSCTAHPRTSYMGGRGAGHLAPVPDPQARFELSTTASGGRANRLCPGAATAVKVTFSSPRYALLTATAGTFAEGDPWDCPNRVLLDKKRSDAHTVTLTAPCRGAPASALLEVTSATGEGAAFRQASVTVPIDASCAAPQCAAQGKAAGR